ncbi:UvrD-helicase domain-containing protein [Candidatus Omnitrophota bacterium]
MSNDKIKARQKVERQKYLDTILQSGVSKILIIGGPGTGKTHAFGEVLRRSSGNKSLVMTFINRLVEDMKLDLGTFAEVRTFHSYCKKILHQQKGQVELRPYITLVIERDAVLLSEKLYDFDYKFQNLEEGSPEIGFYLRRSDYYGVVGFNDCVYRLYKILQTNPDIIPLFDHILIDEFQDFNPLEVAFINELEKKGNIIIVGDDDQAVYIGRCSSPYYLRSLHSSGRFACFELPFCSRCTEVIVNAINTISVRAQSLGYLKGRIPKRFECYIEDKEKDNIKYPNIITTRCTNVKIIPKYIKKEVSLISEEDIAESYVQGKEYPTVLVVGQRQYLREIAKQLKDDYPQLRYSPSEEGEYGIIEAYEEIMHNSESNLGWRILIELFYEPEEQVEILKATEDGRPMVDLLDPDFIKDNLRAIQIIRSIKEGENLPPGLNKELRLITNEYFDIVVEYFTPRESEPELEVDIKQPKILLTSFIGCKGLSAGHVFIVGANNGSIPKDVNDIRDVEISQFIVALSRTRKQCHIISNKWLYSPKDKNGNWLSEFEESNFISWIPNELIKNIGLLSASDFS